MLELAGTATLLERLDQPAIRPDAAEAVADTSRQFGRAGSEARHEDGRGELRQRVNPCVFRDVVAAVMVDSAAFPQALDQFQCLLQHLHADVQCRPAVAQDVLAERLARADPESEPTWQESGGSGGRLGDDRGMDPDHGARHRRRYREPVAGSGNRLPRSTR